MASNSEYGAFQFGTGPGWLQGDNGGLHSSTLGDEKSHQLDLNRQAVLADIPGQAPPDGLALIGADRVLPRAVGNAFGSPAAESDADYAERLRVCWDRSDGHRFRGTHQGMLFALARAGFPTGLAVGAVIIQRTKRYSYLSDTVAGQVVFGVHNGWTFNHEGPAAFNQFGIMFGANIADLSDGTQKALTLNKIVRDWKPAKARYMGAKVVVSGAVWGWPIGITWGQVGLTWGGVTRFIAP